MRYGCWNKFCAVENLPKEKWGVGQKNVQHMKRTIWIWLCVVCCCSPKESFFRAIKTMSFAPGAGFRGGRAVIVIVHLGQ
jgi:hypothetical protein